MLALPNTHNTSTKMSPHCPQQVDPHDRFNFAQASYQSNHRGADDGSPGWGSTDVACDAGAQGAGTERLGLLIRTEGTGALETEADCPSESKLVRGTDVSPAQ